MALPDDVRDALANDQTIDIVTTGARTGEQRTTEIWFLDLDGRIVITGTPGRRDWLANLKANPEFAFRLKESMHADLPAVARIITDETDRREILTSVAARWYREQTDIEHLVAAAPLVEVTFVDADELEAVGSAALDRFIETFNSRDPEAWAASLSYPHVRVSPFRRAATASPTERDYADAVSYDAADAMGWDHSEWDSKDVLAVSPTKIHASAQWCRYDATGERILPNNVSYVITHVDGRWGIQARFGVDSPPPADVDALAGRAEEQWNAWWAAVADARIDQLDAATQFPFHLVDVGQVDQLTTSDELLARLGEAARSTSRAVATPLQVGERGINLSVDLDAGDGPGTHGLFLVTVHDGTVRVAAASLLPQR